MKLYQLNILIQEGPESDVKEAYEIVKNTMENPFNYEFPVKLEVDAKIGNTWYECKQFYLYNIYIYNG